MRARFATREEAARELATRLLQLNLPAPRLVLALPRGGVPIGAEVARRLQAPLDLLLVRKIGAPGQPELAVAAVAEGEGEHAEVVINEDTRQATGTPRAYIEQQTPAAWQEIQRRRRLYLQGRAPLPVAGATVIVVDDGVATGSTMRAALQTLRQRGAARLILAVPLAPHDTVTALRCDVDLVLCLREPSPFGGVGQHYRDFHQVSDDEVIQALASAGGPQ
jgi:putative phosphoribosyl transferase